MKKLLLLIAVVTLLSCNTNIAYVTKTIHVENSENVTIDATQTGSKLDDVLKGNSQKAEGKVADKISGK